MDAPGMIGREITPPETLPEAKKEYLETDLAPFLNQIVFVCDLCGFSNTVFGEREREEREREEGEKEREREYVIEGGKGLGGRERKVVDVCGGCGEMVLGGLVNEKTRKYFRCECKLLVYCPTNQTNFLGKCPKCQQILLVGSPQEDVFRYCVCSYCSKVIRYEQRQSSCCFYWPISITCRACNVSIFLPEKKNESKLTFLNCVISFLIFVAFFFLAMAFFLEEKDMLFHTLLFLICAVLFSVGIYYPKWRWGISQEIDFSDENLKSETMNTVAVAIGTGRSLNVKKSVVEV